MKHHRRLPLITLCLLFFFSAAPLIAQQADDWGLSAAAGKSGIPTASLTGEDSIIATIISNLLSIVGILFLILIIWGGMLWMTSGGNDQTVSKAKSILTAGTIGLIIVLTAYSITYFVIQSLTTIDKPTGQTSEIPQPCGPDDTC